ncbi:hypothetical protein GN956_G4472 [Arapaima gigas]
MRSEETRGTSRERDSRRRHPEAPRRPPTPPPPTPTPTPRRLLLCINPAVESTIATSSWNHHPDTVVGFDLPQLYIKRPLLSMKTSVNMWSMTLVEQQLKNMTDKED